MKRRSIPPGIGNCGTTAIVPGSEGANVTVHLSTGEVSTAGPYDGPVVYQQFAGANSFDDQIPVIGSWYITDQGPQGLGYARHRLSRQTQAALCPTFFRKGAYGIRFIGLTLEQGEGARRARG